MSPAPTRTSVVFPNRPRRTAGRDPYRPDLATGQRPAARPAHTLANHHHDQDRTHRDAHRGD